MGRTEQINQLPVVVHILTGFLGSGKTTHLNRLLLDPALRDTAVIVNEFGEIALDHFLIRGVVGEIVVLANGCVCCTVRTDLAEALVDLQARAARGEVPNFRRVVIETTGLADPVPVLGTLENHPVVRHHVRRGWVITTVDAVNAFAGTEWPIEALRQISAADWVILTKSDLTSSAQQTAVLGRIRAINPLARLTIGTSSTFSNFLAKDSDGANALVQQLLERSQYIPETERRNHRYAHDGVHPNVHAVSIVVDRPIDWPAFGVWVTLLLHAYGDKILRLKGILNVDGANRPIYINGVRHVVHRPIHLEHWPDADRRSRLVLIVAGLEPAAVSRSFRQWVGASSN